MKVKKKEKEQNIKPEKLYSGIVFCLFVRLVGYWGRPQKFSIRKSLFKDEINTTSSQIHDEVAQLLFHPSGRYGKILHKVIKLWHQEAFHSPKKGVCVTLLL